LRQVDCLQKGLLGRLGTDHAPEDVVHVLGSNCRQVAPGGLRAARPLLLLVLVLLLPLCFVTHPLLLLLLLQCQPLLDALRPADER
jgi:hypothetical protein